MLVEDENVYMRIHVLGKPIFCVEKTDNNTVKLITFFTLLLLVLSCFLFFAVLHVSSISEQIFRQPDKIIKRTSYDV